MGTKTKNYSKKFIQPTILMGRGNLEAQISAARGFPSGATIPALSRPGQQAMTGLEGIGAKGRLACDVVADETSRLLAGSPNNWKTDMQVPVVQTVTRRTARRVCH